MASEFGTDGRFAEEEEEEEEEPPRMMTHTMRERLSEKNGPHKTVFGVLSNKKYEVRGSRRGCRRQAFADGAYNYWTACTTGFDVFKHIM